MKTISFILLTAAVVWATDRPSSAESAEGRPNILWITSEDNSPYLGCYGDPQAKTPNLDRLAAQGVRYRNAFSSAPVCSAARTTLITGMNACTIGAHNHRSRVPVPASVVFSNQVFHDAGYYCTNNSKTDYNCLMPGAGKRRGPAQYWDASSKSAHYKNRKDGQPFFAVFNTTLSHEGQTTDKAFHGRRKLLPAKRIVPPGEVILPPYHPDTPVIRENWSRYFDNIWLMDHEVGRLLEELEASREAGNTIVFYYSDHGGALPRGKRNIHDSGTRVPLIIRFPAKWRHLAPAAPGEWVNTPVAFVDFPATAAQLCGIDIPDAWEGKPFLGPKAVRRSHVFLFRGRMDERYDTVRAIRTPDFLYVRNFTPHRPYGQAYTYPFRVMAGMGSWYEAFRDGKCNATQARYWEPKAGEEFYLVKDDPFQVENLIDDARYVDVIRQLRATLRREMVESRDTGLIPEGMSARLAGSGTLREFAQGKGFDPASVFDVAAAACNAGPRDLKTHLAGLGSDNPLVRYWSATAFLVAGSIDHGEGRLLDLLDDPVLDVRTVAAEALGRAGETGKAIPVLLAVLESGNEHEALAAITALENLARAGIIPMKEALAMLPGKVPGACARVVEAMKTIP